MINDLLQNKMMTKYRLSKTSGVPYTTINDICSGKADMKKCSVDTVYRIAAALEVTMEELVEPYYEDRPDFESFKSSICHRLKEMGDIDFVIDILETDLITSYYEKKWYPETMYLLAMLDYVSRENDIPMCDKYDGLRTKKLSKAVFPRSVLALCAAANDDSPKEAAFNPYKEAKRTGKSIEEVKAEQAKKEEKEAKKKARRKKKAAEPQEKKIENCAELLNNVYHVHAPAPVNKADRSIEALRAERKSAKNKSSNTKKK